MVNAIAAAAVLAAAWTGSASAEPGRVRDRAAAGMELSAAPDSRGGGAAVGAGRGRAMGAALSFSQAFDAASKRSRIFGEAERVRGGTPAETDAAAVRKLRRRLEASGVTAARLATALGVDVELIAAFLAGDDAVDAFTRAGLLTKCGEWLDSHDARSGDAGSAETRAVALIRGVLATVRATRTVGLLSGASGMGKTHALRMIAAQAADVLLVRGMPDERSAHAVLSGIGQAAAERGYIPPGRRLNTRAAAAAFRKHGAVLVVDEAQALSAKALEVIRGVYDAAGVGVLLVGTRAAGERLSIHGDPLLAPLVGRVALRVDIESELERGGESWLAMDELAAIVKAAGYRIGDDAIGVLFDIATRAPGRIRAAVNVCRVARVIGGKDAGEIPTRAIREAIRAAGLADLVMDLSGRA